jgi:hypothetical protein
MPNARAVSAPELPDDIMSIASGYLACARWTTGRPLAMGIPSWLAHFVTVEGSMPCILAISAA